MRYGNGQGSSGTTLTLDSGKEPMILDACFLNDLLAGGRAAKVRLDDVINQQLVVPTLAYTEVAVGMEPESRTARKFEEVMERVTLVPYDDTAARRAVDIQRQLRSQGEAIGAVDVMIAGIAVARYETILTRNLDEFSRTRPGSLHIE